MQYTRNEVTLERSTYRVRGDVIDIHPAENDAAAIRVELFDDEIESISEFDPLNGELKRKLPRVTIFPYTHYVTPRETNVGLLERKSVGEGKSGAVRWDLGGERCLTKKNNTRTH